MTNGYLEVIALMARLHRHFLEVVKLELDGLGIHDINNVQGMAVTLRQLERFWIRASDISQQPAQFAA